MFQVATMRIKKKKTAVRDEPTWRVAETRFGATREERH